MGRLEGGKALNERGVGVVVRGVERVDNERAQVLDMQLSELERNRPRVTLLASVHAVNKKTHSHSIGHTLTRPLCRGWA